MIKNIIEQYYNKIFSTDCPKKQKKILTKIYFIWHIFFNILDPKVKVKIGNKFLTMNLSHSLPFNYYNFSNYDRALSRICKKIKEIDKELYVVDIGANIGDTVSLITDTVDGNFLCVEGDKKYLSILERNISNINLSDIKIEKKYCGSPTDKKIKINHEKGTGKIIRHEHSIFSIKKSDEVTIESLDNIIMDNPDFKKTNLLKIDTDGFEIEVLNSGINFIKKTTPVLYFEYTPELYLQNNQDPKLIWKILKACGYEHALFYDNFGKAVKIVNVNDLESINQLLKMIDNQNIFYYDILSYPAKSIKYREILESELLLFK